MFLKISFYNGPMRGVFMEHMLLKTRLEKLNLEKGIVLGMMTFLLTLLKVYDTSLLFTLPMMMLAFVNGWCHLIMCLCAFLIASYFQLFMLNEMIVLGIAFFVLIIFSRIPRMKPQYLPSIMAGILGIELLLLRQFDISSLFLVGMTYIHSVACLKVAVLFTSEDESVYTRQRWMILLCMILVCSLQLEKIHPLLMMSFIHLFILIGLYHIGIKEALVASFYIAWILLLMDPTYKEEMIGLLIPLSFFLLYQPKTKLYFCCFYILIHGFCPLFTDISLTHLAVMMGISGAFFLILPAFDMKESILDDSFQEVTLNTKMVSQIHSFSHLFKQLTLLFQEDKKPVDTLEFTGEMYETVCANCSSMKQCYRGGEGPNRLIKLIRKGIVEDLDVEEKEYKQRLTQLKRDYKRVHRMNKEYLSMKKDLYHQFALLANVLDHFSMTIETGQLTDHQLKDMLIGYQYDIIFLKKEVLSTYEYDLKIGMASLGKHTLYEEFLPLVEKLLHTSFEVSLYRETMPKLGYAYVVLHHRPAYRLSYGVAKRSKDPQYCGDSHTYFRFQEKEYIAISDGMGYGKEASEESQLTLNVLHQLLINGVTLEETLHSINALLKIKNRMDMYTTLDLCEIDLIKGRARFIKNGAISSFVIRHHKMKKIQGTSLPMGIISKLDQHEDLIDLEDQDLIIMASDGILPDGYQIIEQDKDLYLDLSPQEIADRLLEQLQDQMSDDATLIALRFYKD